MKASSFLYFTGFGIKTILFRKKKPILGTVIVADVRSACDCIAVLIGNRKHITPSVILIVRPQLSCFVVYSDNIAA